MTLSPQARIEKRRLKQNLKIILQPKILMTLSWYVDHINYSRLTKELDRRFSNWCEAEEMQSGVQ